MSLTKRTNSLDFLHPIVRRAARLALDQLRLEDVRFRAFETYRTPERQKLLRSKRPKVSNAGPWQSMHQYGLAVDFVIDINGVNPWSTDGHGHRKMWREMHRIVGDFGLHPIKGELPHMQLEGFSWRDCKAGRYPEGGDDPWVCNLHEAVLRYPKGAPKVLPDYPEDVLECRPPLD